MIVVTYESYKGGVNNLAVAIETVPLPPAKITTFMSILYAFIQGAFPSDQSFSASIKSRFVSMAVQKP